MLSSIIIIWVSLVAQTVKDLPIMQETWVQSLDWEDTLEKGMATHSSTLAWRIPRTEEPGIEAHSLSSTLTSNSTENGHKEIF